MVSSIYASSPTALLEMDPQTITEIFSNFTLKIMILLFKIVNALRHNMD